MLKGIQVSFNVDVDRLRELGLDVTTSEGKAGLKQMFLDGLGAALELSVGEEPNDELPVDDIRRELLKS